MYKGVVNNYVLKLYAVFFHYTQPLVFKELELIVTFGLATKMRGEIGRVISIDNFNDRNEAIRKTFMQYSYRLRK
jgi:hypothetical protein